MAGPVLDHPARTSGVGDQPDRQHHRCHHDRGRVQHCHRQRSTSDPPRDVTHTLPESDILG